MSFDLRHLRYVVAAAAHRSFFRAALALDVEQSTMSRNITRLERRLGVKLFRRSHAGVSPTAAGVEFIRTAEDIVAKADTLAGAMRSAGQEPARQLTVGYQTTNVIDPLRDLLVTLRTRFPGLVLNRVEGSRETLLLGLESGAVDVVILANDGRLERIADSD